MTDLNYGLMKQGSFITHGLSLACLKSVRQAQFVRNTQSISTVNLTVLMDWVRVEKLKIKSDEDLG